MLPPYSHMRTHVRTRAHTRTCIHAHMYTSAIHDGLIDHHVAPLFLFMPRQLPHQHAITKYIFIHFNLKEIELNFIKLQKKFLKTKKFITFKIQLQINPDLFHWIRNSIIYHYKKSKYLNNKRINYYFKNTLISS